MQKLINTENIQTFIQQILTLKTDLDTVSQTMGSYVDHLKQEKLVAMTNETYEEEYKRKEGILDRLEMTITKRKQLNEKGKETIALLKETMETVEKIVKEGEQSGGVFKKAKNELIDEIIEARRKEEGNKGVERNI